MQNFWTEITAPQATIVAGGLTVFAAVFGVLLGSWLFSGRVRDLKGALDESDKLLRQHKTSVEASLAEVTDSIGSLNEQIASTMQGLAQVRSDVSDIALSEQPEEEQPIGAPSREKLKEDWNAVRDVIEATAAHPDIDGRTRAKYGRVDRRNYNELIDLMAHDNVVGENEENFRNAIKLWQSYRTGKKQLTKTDADRMASIRGKIGV